jgi:predicted regulator of Ras-like GTPase activity (Roadblock/LC7/MglB family)
VPFKAIVDELVNTTPGASGAILADWEGEAVVQCCHFDDYELKVIAAHNGILFNLMKDVHRQFADGGVREAVIATDRFQVIVGAVGPDYCLVMTFARDGILGRALYRFRNAVELLRKEIY